MSTCPHPPHAQHFDRARGMATCTLCGEVITDQQFEMDPAFGRGDRPAASARPGFLRPARVQSQLGAHGVSRPTLEAARRKLTAIARQLDVPPAHVDAASVLFKVAAGSNAVAGARDAVLSACLYIVCRRNGTPHMVLDFSDVVHESPQQILRYVKVVCRATHSELPPIDPSMFVARIVQELDVGAEAEAVNVFAVKVLRAMRAEWIHTGRRPLGVCAAAVLVACQAQGIVRSMDHIAELIRLSPSTVLARVDEFARTVGHITCIDDFQPAEATAPVAYTRGLATAGELEAEVGMRAVAELYFELVNEAKQGAPATAERCEKWLEFLGHKCQNTGGPPAELADLTRLSSAEQLRVLEVRHGDTVVSVKPPTQTQEDRKEDVAEALAKARHMLEGDGTIELDALESLSQQSAALTPGLSAVSVPTEVLPPAGTTEREAAVQELLRDNPTAEVLVLGAEEDAETDYVVWDGDERIRREQALKAAFAELWDKAGERYIRFVAARTGEGKATQRVKRRRQAAPLAATPLDALKRSLGGRGAGQLDLDQLDHILPDVDEAPDDGEWLLD